MVSVGAWPRATTAVRAMVTIKTVSLNIRDSYSLAKPRFVISKLSGEVGCFFIKIKRGAAPVKTQFSVACVQLPCQRNHWRNSSGSTRFLFKLTQTPTASKNLLQSTVIFDLNAGVEGKTARQNARWPRRRTLAHTFGGPFVRRGYRSPGRPCSDPRFAERPGLSKTRGRLDASGGPASITGVVATV